MTKVVDTKLLSDRGVLTVGRILNGAGATSEVIVNDVGEDLLVQTQHRSVADAFHVLVQVKSTAELPERKDGTFAVRVDVDHLYRWAMHVSPVLLCVYDHSSRRVYAIDARHQFSLWELATTPKKSLLVRFGPEQRLTASTAGRIVWDYRVEHFSWYEYSIFSARAIAGNPRRAKHFANERNLVAFRMLEALGVIKGDAIVPKVRTYIDNASRSFARKNETEGAELTLTNACGLALLGLVHDIGAGGLPTLAMEVGARVTESALRAFHPRLWARANGRLSAET